MNLARAMPVLVFALLLGLPRAFPNRAVVDAATAGQWQVVADAVAAVPYRIGPWAGRDEQFAPAAIQLLHPNAILSRRYERIGGGGTVSLVVHCTDVRDMRGHWPPMCYPANGWAASPPLPEDGAAVELAVAGRKMAAREYEYQRSEAGGWESRIRVVNLFVLPDGRVTGELREISRQSERLARAVQGVAQVQIVTPAIMQRDQAAAAASELLEGMPDLLEALGAGALGDGS